MVGCSVKWLVNTGMDEELTVNTEKREKEGRKVEKFLHKCIFWETLEGKDSEGHGEAELQGGQSTEPSDEESRISSDRLDPGEPAPGEEGHGPMKTEGGSADRAGRSRWDATRGRRQLAKNQQ